MFYIGVDPGKSGAAACVDDDRRVIWVVKFNGTFRDIADNFSQHISLLEGAGSIFAFIESVHSMPKQGVKSSFTFGQYYGMAEMCLICNLISYEHITPNTWMTTLKCRSGGDKNITKAKAQGMFPKTTITHATADALLIAEYARSRYYTKANQPSKRTK